ncbi:MAG TPA: DUF1192 domain-containing protein [Alphaproteobacteria bacterium]|nr:DUF1192 domain-containing protein [Alphaproteobacteria bacterium]
MFFPCLSPDEKPCYKWAMINPDELESPRPTLKPLDLQQMSVEELHEYIAALEAEIARVEEMITKKEKHKSGVEALFGKPKG